MLIHDHHFGTICPEKGLASCISYQVYTADRVRLAGQVGGYVVRWIDGDFSASDLPIKLNTHLDESKDCSDARRPFGGPKVSAHTWSRMAQTTPDRRAAALQHAMLIGQLS